MDTFFANIKQLLKKNKKTLICIAAIALAVLFCILWIGSLVSTQRKVEEAGVIGDVRYTPLEGVVVMVDAGHGGTDSGMTSISGRLEKEVNLEISKRLRNLLEARGAEVIMTRQTDNWLGESKEEDFTERERMVLRANADLFVSIHCNSHDNQEATGPQVFFVEQGAAGKPLAEMIQATMNEALEPEQPRMAVPAAYRLLKTGAQPSCIVECGFLSNPEEDALLQTPEYQQKIAQSITDGIIRYMQEYGE